ncbi:MAG: thioesterase [Actinobacteria bacterium]|nr:thioesterase [Actinomycetota bacterium]
MGSWLVPWGVPGAGATVLVCLPQAGAGCRQYRGWRAHLDVGAVIGVQLPGREERWNDPPADRFDQVVEVVVTELAAMVADDVHLVIYGHSFGGLIGYELARAWGRRRGRWPAAVVVAACRPPALWVGAGRGLVDDETELAALLGARGLDPKLLDEDSRADLIEILRLDARLSLSYRPGDGVTVPCRLEAWGGIGDETVTSGQLDGWSGYTTGPFRRRDLPGGHTFHSTSAGPALAALRDLLGTVASPHGPAGCRRVDPIV